MPPVDEGATRSATSRSLLGEDVPQSLRDAAAETLPAEVPLRGEPLRAGRVVAGRYRLVEPIGAGAHGEVWAADDLVVGEPVAIKWMAAGSGALRARIRREVTTLRILRIPGVVRLIDDGVEGGHPYLVMDRVLGAPFPGGSAGRCAWADLAAPAIALLDVLGRVHAAGIVHRDLKPDNVLVSADGRPTLLDFGISRGSDPGARLTEGGRIVGTPLYLAPEQIVDGALDGRTDLYAVGVMLYAALTGRVPHEASSVDALLRARLMDRPAPVADLASDAPPEVAAAIERLLSTRMEERFRSAAEAIAALRGEAAGARGSGADLPRLGDGRALSALIQAAREGRPIDLVGPAGSGRSRCLRDAAEVIAAEGRRVAWTRPSGAPFSSLRPVLAALAQGGSSRLAEITAAVGAELDDALAAGLVLIADDAERIDPWSAAAIDRCRGVAGGAGEAPPARAIVRALLAAPVAAAGVEVARLEPLDEAALRALFLGPDRLFHVREDAARALRERTGGSPARVEAELMRWARIGLARRDGAAFVIDREALGRLAAGSPGAAPAAAASAELAGEPLLAELLAWLALGGHPIGLAQLAEATGQPLWQVEAGCEELVARRAAQRLPDDRVIPRRQIDPCWTDARRLDAHRALARVLVPGEEGRLLHLVAAKDAREAAREAVELARCRAAGGDLAAAIAALGEGLAAARALAEGGRREELSVLTEWVKIAFEQGTPRALDRALYELSRAARGPEVERLEALVRAVGAAPGASGARALDLAEDLPAFDDPELERRRQGVRVVVAASRSSPEMLEEVLEDVAAWAERSGEPMARWTLLEGQALLRHAQGRYEEAATLHAEAAGEQRRAAGRIASMQSAASALLEGFRHREAAEQAAAARDATAACRHPYGEGRAEWLLRAARYRLGEAVEPDLELVEAVARVGVPELEALVCLNEAAVAFRSGAARLAVELAGRAADLWRRLDRPAGALLARCLALACGAPAEDGEMSLLVGKALQCAVPGMGAQALGLLGRAAPAMRGQWAGAVEGLLEGIPRERWGLRMDVLSAEEALAWAEPHRNE